jgi:hypothetical protein
MKLNICVLGTITALAALVGCAPPEAVDDDEQGAATAAVDGNLLVNGSFATSMSGWTETVTGGDGNGGSGWISPGSPSGSGGALLTSISPGCYSQDYCVGNYANYWSQRVQLTAGSSHTLSFAYLSQHGTWSFADLSVVLVKPSGAYATLFITGGSGGAWQTWSQNIGSQLTETGSYALRMVSNIGNDLGAYAEGRFDEVVLH